MKSLRILRLTEICLSDFLWAADSVKERDALLVRRRVEQMGFLMVEW